MEQLLRGDTPGGGHCDLKTLASQARVTRTGFYPKGDRPGPCQHLAEEFGQRLRALRETGNNPDPSDAQITRLKTENTRLKERLTSRDAAIEELAAFKTLAICQLAAQHQEIERLNSRQPPPATVSAIRRPRPQPEQAMPKTSSLITRRPLTGIAPAPATAAPSPVPPLQSTQHDPFR